MPEPSTIKKFVESLKTGETNTTKVLEKLFGSQQALQALSNHPNVTNGDLARANALSSGANGGLPVWAKQELQGQGPASGLLGGLRLSDKELEHIDSWPAPQRDRVRGALAAAVSSGNPVHFSWELHAGNAEETEPPAPAITSAFAARGPRCGSQPCPPWAKSTWTCSGPAVRSQRRGSHYVGIVRAHQNGASGASSPL